MNTSRAFLVGSVATVAGSTAFLPLLGTDLAELLLVGSWSLVAAASSGAFANQNGPLVWTLALFVNLALFTAPAALAYLLLRNRSGRLCLLVLASWLAFYLTLFFLFPQADGP